MANNGIGCSVGKTTLVDPNLFYGQNSSNNISVPLEDLNISVELTTSKKERTILISDTEGGATVDKHKNLGKVKVNFIEGSQQSNGEKVLTTAYTNLTTSFDDNVYQNLGINNIDIDFNTSYAPLITINFIDLRGSAIFQNEANVASGNNKYSVLFQLPYPIFQLTIKGYYGMPVKYCLHMTKFNARFNSQTGNFEITASFIGYTYAMLTDMLIGYLKAIPYTELGSHRFDEMKKLDNSLMRLDELIAGISNINQIAYKIKATDPDSIRIVNDNKKMGYLSDIEGNLNSLRTSMDINKDLVLNNYYYIIVDPDNVAYAPSSIKLSTTESIEKEKYTNNVTNNVNSYNSEGNFILTVDSFTLLKSYQSISIDLLDPLNDIKDPSNRLMLINKLNYNGTDFDAYRNKIRQYLITYGKIGTKKEVNFYDLSSQYALLAQYRTLNQNEITQLKIRLGDTMKREVTNELGFEPTIRNIVKIFCAHVEIFLGVIYDVSAAAKHHPERTKELQKFSNEVGSFDISNKALTPTSGVEPQYYPWPEFRKGTQEIGLTESYLGEIGVLNDPNNVDELRFINNLMEAFITSSKADEHILNKVQDLTNAWFSVNPLDTKYFNKLSPYTRNKFTRIEDVMALIMVRATTYLGYSNKTLTTQEIQAVANLEADAVLKNVGNEYTSLLKNKTASDYTSVSDYINGVSTPMFTEFKDTVPVPTAYSVGTFGDQGAAYLAIPNTSPNANDKYIYNYIKSNDGTDKIKVIPISNPISGDWVFDKDYPSLITRRDNNSDKFLTNYSSKSVIKLDDGGIYTKILSGQDLINYYGLAPNRNSVDTTIVVNFDALKQKTLPLITGFNQTGGLYGTQDFSEVDFGSEIGVMPLNYIFYFDKFSEAQNYLGYRYGLSSGRKSNADTKFDYNTASPNVIKIPKTYSEIRLAEGNQNDYGKNIDLFKVFSPSSHNVSVPFIRFGVIGNSFDLPETDRSFSLFGSDLYYGQNTGTTGNPSPMSRYAKALLFLHSLPWRGLGNSSESDLTGIFNKTEISNLFSNRAGFITVPKLWVAFIGGLLWRIDPRDLKIDNTGKLFGGSGSEDPIKFVKADGSSLIPFNKDRIDPTRYQYLFGLDSKSSYGNTIQFAGGGYTPLEEVILYLPYQVKNEFIRQFLDFVGEPSVISDWARISSQLELMTNTYSLADWESAYATITSTITSASDSNYMNTNTMSSHFTSASLTNYITIIPMSSTEKGYENNWFLELRGDGKNVNVNTSLIQQLSNEVIIVNTNYKIWSRTPVQTEIRDDIAVKMTDMKIYVEALVAKFQNDKDALTPDTAKKQNEQLIWGTSDENIIKFNLYRTIKNIYDKWVGGADDGDSIIFQCGSHNDIDFGLAEKNGRKTPTLIDSFRFVTRSFKDIGDTFIINPLPILDVLLGNPNSSFYDIVTSILSANNFDFIPLPSYINYNDPKTLQTMFQPMQYSEAIGSGIAGPSFVCVYVGQSSKALDLGDSNYPNDSFDFRCDNYGNMIPGYGTDFGVNVSKINGVPYENQVAVFAVNYGQQNQNIFKDITLDQSEFTETAESLKIIDNISKLGKENNRTYIGQNLFNVYSVRSYKTEIEMMGNAMIQPMMYFQLNNIPMFHGAYMIIRVKHNIKPNFMSTHFTGVRIRKPETPLINVGSLYMNMLDSMEVSTVNITSSAQPILNNNDIKNANQLLFPYVTYDVVEKPGILVYNPDPSGVVAGGDNVAIQEVGEFMEELAIRWHNFNGDVLYINFFAKCGGGLNDVHSKLWDSDITSHKEGLAVSLHPMTTNNRLNENWGVACSNYSQQKNIDFIKMALDLSVERAKVITIRQIILSDEQIIAQFNGRVINATGNNDYISIDFNIPLRVEQELNGGPVNTNLNTSTPKGGISFGTIAKLSPSQMEASVGKEFQNNTKISKEDKALLDMLAYAEGVIGVSQNGYDVTYDFGQISRWNPNTDIIFGGGPNNPKPWPVAAGRYQFQSGTWGVGSNNLPMTKENQDNKAIILINGRLGLIDKTKLNIRANFNIATDKLAKTWAAIPLSRDIVDNYPSANTTHKAGVSYYPLNPTIPLTKLFEIYNLGLSKYA